MMFQRGDFIVRAARERVPISDDRETLAWRLVRVKTQHLVDRLTRIIDFQKFDARRRKWGSINCPSDLAAAYLERSGEWNLPVIAGFINAPTLRPNGSILEAPGYDTATKIFYAPSEEYPPIPQQPTREEAWAALDVLIGLINEFPFVLEDDSDATGKPSPSRSVALSLILSTMIRHSLPRAPLHAFTAPIWGSGKTKLVDLASTIKIGHEAPVISAGKDETEMEKRLGAALLAGDTLILFDNCEHPLGGTLLCQALTQPLLNIRVLGRSENVTLPVNAMFGATGNNLVLIADMTRRAITGKLDPKVERPENREFDFDPIEVVKADRSTYVVAALTVLRAYFVAGKPAQKSKPLGSFEVWSRTVRDALLWLGEPDPCATIHRTRKEHPETQALSEALSQWRYVSGTIEVTSKRAIECAAEKDGCGEFKNSDFREALLVAAGDRGAVNSTQLGKWLTKSKGRVVAGWRFEAGVGTARGGVLRWKVCGSPTS
jgi:hypothetical protein